MAISALHSASTGLSALSTSLDVIANNLANMNTNGFKTSRVNFEDLLYQQKAQPGVENTDAGTRPHGIQVGLGTRISGTQINFTQGDPVQDDNDLSMAISGKGFFQVKIMDGQSKDGFGYTRVGNFSMNSERQIVLGSSTGPRLEPEITVPEGIASIRVDPNGVVTAIDNENVETQLGQIELCAFANPSGLRQIGGNIYVETDASGAFEQAAPGEESMGTILHKFLESSNVNPTNELVSLITTQRAFELNSQTVQAANETMQVISNLRK